MRDISIATRLSRAPRVVAASAGFTVAAAGVVVGMVTLGATAVNEVGALAQPQDAVGQPIESLRAAPVNDPTLDFDGDGLPDAQEEVLHLMPFSADSDGDGYGDGEELARQTDPLDDESIPMSDAISCTLTARGGGDMLRLVIGIHEPEGEVGQSKMRIGALTSHGAVSVPLGRFLGYADIYTSEGTDSSAVTMIDIPIQARFVHVHEQVTFFLAAGNQSEATFDAAAKVDVQSVDGVLMLVRPVQANLQSFQGGGAIRQPIPQSSSPSIPTTWIPGAICYQRSATVGANGAVVLKEIVEADCLQGWDTFCASDCASSVGMTYETIDPAALVGG